MLVTTFHGAWIRHLYREANGATYKLVAQRHHLLPAANIVSHLELMIHVHADAIGFGPTDC